MEEKRCERERVKGKDKETEETEDRGKKTEIIYIETQKEREIGRNRERE
jgi:hypothetical protein